MAILSKIRIHNATESFIKMTLDDVSFLHPLKNYPLYARLCIKGLLLFLVAWGVEWGLFLMKAPVHVWIIERTLTVVCTVCTLQKDVFEQIQLELNIRKCPHQPLTFKTRLPLLLGPLGTWSAISFVLWGGTKIMQRVTSDTPLSDYETLWIMLSIHGLILLLFTPRFLAFYPLLRYLKHPRPFHHAYQLSRTWRFYLLIVILSPFLVGIFFVISKLPSTNCWLQTAPLFVPYTIFVLMINVTCVVLLCLSLIREELRLKEQEMRNDPFISGRPITAKNARPFVKSP